MTNVYSAYQQRLVIIACALTTAMGFIDATALNVALPVIQTALSASTTDAHWVLEIYLLFLAALMMAGGALGDTIGRRRSMRWGIVAFAVTSLACGLAVTPFQLILARAAQGIAAALMVPASLALINASFAPGERGPAIGRWSAMLTLAIPLGPVVGGLAVDYLSWRLIFFINLPVSLVVLWLLSKLPKPPFEPENPLPLDIWGSALITAGLGLLITAALEAGRVGTIHTAQLGLGMTGLVFLLGFFIYEARARHPMLPPFLMVNRRFILVSVQTLILFAGFQGGTFFLNFMVIQGYDYGAFKAGVTGLPITLIVAVMSRRTGSYVSTHGPRGILMASGVLLAIALYWLSYFDGDFWAGLVLPMCVLGLGVGCFATPLTTVAMAAAGPGRDGLASGVSNAAARIGPLLAIAVFGYFQALVFGEMFYDWLMQSGLTSQDMQILRGQQQMMAVMNLPESWPASQSAEVRADLQAMFSDTVRQILRISAGFALLAGLLSVFYRKDDVR
ncbi:MAG: MFS transporter [Candidatus Puniceispirillaceae bacterium]